MTKEQNKAICEWLDERFWLAKDRDARMGNENGKEFLPNNADYIYYKGIIDALENLGFTWVRENGKHRFWKA